MNDTDLMFVEPMSLYIGEPYVINDKITIFQPKIRDIVAYGESDYWRMTYTICATSADLKVKLYDMGINWMEISNFELFIMMSQALNKEMTSILLGDLDLSSMKLYRNKENGEILLANIDSGVKIDRLLYERMMNVIRKMHRIKPNNEKARNKATMRAMIENERQMMASNENKEYSSYLLPLISSVKCKMGYTKDYILNEGLFEFFDDVARLQTINNADHLLTSIYSGNIDIKNIDKKSLNWMAPLEQI